MSVSVVCVWRSVRRKVLLAPGGLWCCSALETTAKGGITAHNGDIRGHDEHLQKRNRVKDPNDEGRKGAMGIIW